MNVNENVNVNEQNQQGETLLECACNRDSSDFVKLLLRHPHLRVNLQSRSGWGGNGPFLVASSGGNFGCVDLLIKDARTDLNLCNNNGWSPFMAACFHGHTLIVELFLAFGRVLDISKKVKKDFNQMLGMSALDLAIRQKRHDIVQLLLDYQQNMIETRKKLCHRLNLQGSILFFFLLSQKQQQQQKKNNKKQQNKNNKNKNKTKKKQNNKTTKQQNNKMDRCKLEGKR